MRGVVAATFGSGDLGQIKFVRLVLSHERHFYSRKLHKDRLFEVTLPSISFIKNFVTKRLVFPDSVALSNLILRSVFNSDFKVSRILDFAVCLLGN
jgi:hypothetical protein